MSHQPLNTSLTISSLSIQAGRTIKTFINCSWVTTQIIDGHSFHVVEEPDLVIGHNLQVENYILLGS